MDRATRDDVVELLRFDWLTIADRLAGLTDAEMAWMPDAGGWTLRPDGSGRTGTADWSDPDPDPAPVTTIGWRMWHLAVDCFDSYSARLFGSTAAGYSGRTYPLDAAEAAAALTRSWEHFAAGVAAWSDEEHMAPLGPAWGPYSTSTHLALAFHAQHELVHHGAEIGVLRDLYRAHGLEA